MTCKPGEVFGYVNEIPNRGFCSKACTTDADCLKGQSCVEGRKSNEPTMGMAAAIKSTIHKCDCGADQECGHEVAKSNEPTMGMAAAVKNGIMVCSPKPSQAKEFSLQTRPQIGVISSHSYTTTWPALQVGRGALALAVGTCALASVVAELAAGGAAMLGGGVAADATVVAIGGSVFCFEQAAIAIIPREKQSFTPIAVAVLVR
jgi:hypothetical protein